MIKVEEMPAQSQDYGLHTAASSCRLPGRGSKASAFESTRVGFPAKKTLLKQCSLGDTENVLGLEYTYQHMTNIWSLGAA